MAVHTEGATRQGTDLRASRPSRLSTETKHALKTTEFWAYLASVAGVLIASWIVTSGKGVAHRGHPLRRLHGQPRPGEVRQQRAVLGRREHRPALEGDRSIRSVPTGHIGGHRPSRPERPGAARWAPTPLPGGNRGC